MQQENDKQIRELPELIPVSRFNDFIPYPTVYALRQIIFKEDFNGFKKVVRKIGNRQYIKTDEFFKWVDNQNLDRI